MVHFTAYIFFIGNPIQKANTVADNQKNSDYQI